ncbi:MAG TPA: DUF2254 family protein, partial [Porticoccaceae bacterium]
AALAERLAVPYLGATPWPDDDVIPAAAVPVHACAIGYIQFIDMPVLAELCDEVDCEAYFPCNPGTFVFEDTVLAWLLAPHELPEDFAERVAKHFVIATTRSFDQDPRFGLAVMAEIACRAMSPAINDPGTAIDVVGRQARLLSQWAAGREDVAVDYPRLHLPPLRDDDLFEDAFMLLARDGAGLVEVQLRLQKALKALQRQGSLSFRRAAAAQSELALQRSETALTCEVDRQRLRALASEPSV